MGRILKAVISSIFLTALVIYFGGFGLEPLLSLASFSVCRPGETAVPRAEVVKLIDPTAKTAQVQCLNENGERSDVDPATAFKVITATYALGFFLLNLIFPPISGKNSTPKPTPTISKGAVAAQLSAADREKLAELMKGGNLIDAIKFARQVTHLGLKDAKDLTEQIRNGSIKLTSQTFITNLDETDRGMKLADDTEATELRLEKLNELLKRGLVTQSEFDQKRKEIIDDL